MNRNLVIRCDECGWRQQLEREILWPQVICLVCHCCEAPLIVDFEKVASWVKAQPVHA